MKKLIFIVFLVFPLLLEAQTKYIIDRPGCIEIVDSAFTPVDRYIIFRSDHNPPMIKSYHNVDWVYIFLNKEDLNNKKSIEPDIKLNYNDFIDFSTADALCVYLRQVLQSNFSGYTLLYNMDANDNIDTVWYKVPTNNDTSFLKIYYWTSTVLDSSKYIQDNE